MGQGCRHERHHDPIADTLETRIQGLAEPAPSQPAMAREMKHHRDGRAK